MSPRTFTKVSTMITLIEVDVNQMDFQKDTEKEFYFCDGCIEESKEQGYTIKIVGKRKEAKYGSYCESCDNNWFGY